MGARGLGIGGIIIFIFKTNPAFEEYGSTLGGHGRGISKSNVMESYCLNASPAPTETATLGRPAEWQSDRRGDGNEGDKTWITYPQSDRGKTTRGAETKGDKILETHPMPSLKGC